MQRTRFTPRRKQTNLLTANKAAAAVENGLCLCGCGEKRKTHRQYFVTVACRKRNQRAREREDKA